MHASNAIVPTALPAVQFESNQDFQKRNVLHEGDASALHRYQGKSWMQKPKGDTRANREVITTLLTAQGENSGDCIEKLLAGEISYRDLGSLTHADLELMDFKHVKQRQELLSFFEQLPNQDPTYDTICKMREASSYNSQIFNSATAHLEAMRSALSTANYKLNIMPPEDVIVGEKSFASRFVLEALKELKTVTDDIDQELDELEELISDSQQAKKGKKKSKKTKHGTNFATSNLFWLSSVGLTSAVAAVCLIYYFNL